MNGTGSVQEYRDLLCRLAGVLSAHVVLDANGGVEEIHILATTAKRPKSVVRDVQSALASKYGVQVDHQVVSVAQIRPEMAEQMGFRLVLEGVSTRTNGKELHVTVTLSKGGNMLQGEATGANTSFSRRRTVALACLAAVSQCTSTPFELAGVETVTLFGEAILVCQIYSPLFDKSFVGSAVLEQDADVSAVQCVLAALNRRLAILPGGAA